AHFVGDHGEAAALLAGPRSLDGRVQGQQVGLLGDAVDDPYHRVDAGAVRFQLVDDDGRFFDVLDEAVDAVQRFTGHMHAGLGLAVGVVGGGGGLVGVARDFLHGGAHFIHRRGDHVGLAALLHDRAES